ncbi:MAG: hypothetical protein PVG07_16000 [Acidobacteriota bacterium]|jgi:hypothetical protein
MESKKILFLAAVCCAVVAAGVPAWATPAAGSPALTVGQAAAHDVSQPVRDVRVEPRFPKGFQVEIPHHSAPQRARPNLQGQPDPLRQTDAEPLVSAAATPSPILNFPGLSDDDNAATIGGRIVPPDTEGDIGPDHYVQWINLIWAVWDVTRDVDGVPTGATMAAGFPQAGNSFWAGFTGSPAADACRNNNDGDPIVIYDHLADRWFVSQFSINEGVQCIAVSQTGDPTGSYDRWAFVVSPGENNDYPKFGLMPDAYYLSLRDFPSDDGTFASATAFDRAALLAGDPNATFIKFSMPCLSGDCPDGIQPPHLEGPAPAAGTPGIFTKAWDDDFEGPLTGADGYRLWEFTPDFATPANSTFTELPFVVSPTGWDSTVCGFFQRNCIGQPKRGGGEGLDPADELQMYRAQYRSFTGYDALVLNTTVDSDGNDTAGVRWAELRNDGSGWSLYQEGTYAPADGENRWMGSAAMNGDGDIALGYSLSSKNTFPSVRYTTRTAADPLGVMAGGEVEMIAGSGSQTQSYNRWGDYSSMSVDPVDDCTFWYTQEYYENTNSFDFKTRIGAFAGPSCGGGGSCTVTEDPEVTCDDGQDNDCDTFVDCDDTDCGGDPACDPGGCFPQGASCTVDSDCCSEKCRGPAGGKTCK